MIKKLRQFGIYLLFIIFLGNCGNNTDTPFFPLFFLNPIGSPQVIGVIPGDTFPLPVSNDSVISYEAIPSSPTFTVKYYVTNSEPQFVGYNLYITETDPTLVETRTGSAVYLENGIQPSFKHFVTEASTERAAMVRKHIKYRIPPPGLVPFQKCEIYNFSLRAVLSNGTLSYQSAAVRACASKFPSKCIEGKSCNPPSCNTASCSDKTACVVGTLCNPCDSTKAIDPDNGCECKDGQFPPGCNL